MFYQMTNSPSKLDSLSFYSSKPNHRSIFSIDLKMFQSGDEELLKHVVGKT